jgi:hypothetical protein
MRKIGQTAASLNTVGALMERIWSVFKLDDCYFITDSSIMVRPLEVVISVLQLESNCGQMKNVRNPGQSFEQ